MKNPWMEITLIGILFGGWRLVLLIQGGEDETKNKRCIEWNKKEYFKYPEDFSTIKSINKTLYEEGKFKEAKFGYFLNSLDEEYSKIYNINDNFDLQKFNDTIIKTLHQNDINVTRKTFVKNDGELFNQNPCSKKEAKVPIKKGMDIKYGGYTSLNQGYFVLVNYKKGNKFMRLLKKYLSKKLILKIIISILVFLWFLLKLSK